MTATATDDYHRSSEGGASPAEPTLWPRERAGTAGAADREDVPVTATSTSLDERRLRDVTPNHAGDVDDDTYFEYREEPDGIVHASYEGGSVRLGYLVGTRTDDDLEFRCTHVTENGETASGRCRSRIELLPDGRVRMHETWEWTSRPGRGTSIIEEVRADRSAAKPVRPT